MFLSLQKTKKVESLKIPKGYNFEDENINHNKVFKRMQSLQVLIVDNKIFCSESTVTCLPSSLRWIQWPFYPSSSLPQQFEPSHLVGLRLYNSRLVELWPISKVYLYTLSLSPIQQNSRFFLWLGLMHIN